MYVPKALAFTDCPVGTDRTENTVPPVIFTGRCLVFALLSLPSKGSTCYNIVSYIFSYSPPEFYDLS